jgi:two-component system response regulator TctD
MPVPGHVMACRHAHFIWSVTKLSNTCPSPGVFPDEWPRHPIFLHTHHAMKLLLIEDDPSLRTTLARTLGRRGWAVSTCEDGGLALRQWETVQPDVVALDLTLPHVDGLQLLTIARQRGWLTPVLILTARGTVGDRVMGLNTGADDYLAKPFDLDELEARLRALCRRSVGVAAGGATGGMVDRGHALGSLRLDPESGAAYNGDAILDLPPRELALLQALMARPGRAVAKERLFELVFPGAVDVQYEAIEVVVYRLRKRLDSTGVALVTLRGLGYLLKVDA